MCGLVGIYESGVDNHRLMETMLKSIEHRGPDASTSYTHKNTILGHRRLSIIDLSTGDQPIFNREQNKCIVYNGEIYNYKDIRSRLIGEGYSFATSSDTEVILAAYERYGEQCLKMLNGIFAFAIYDLRTEELFIARDHFGIKPLHYYVADNLFVFASEQKAILEHPRLPRELNKQALHLHINLRYTQGNETLFAGIKRLAPAHFIKYCKGKLTIKKYWQLEPVINHDLTYQETSEKFNSLLKQAVQRQLVSDVPIGVYLSGGLDSSAIVEKMHSLGVEKINTFTLGFNEPTDEFSDANIIAKKFNTNHRELSLAMDPLKDMDKVVWHAEEPKINLLQGYNLSKFVQPHVKVVLGGLGGDELMAGYDIHRLIYPSRKFHKYIPRGLQTLLNWKSNFLFRLQTGTKSFKFDEYRRGMQMLLSIGQIEKYYLIIRNVWDFDSKQYENIYSMEYSNYTKDNIPKAVTQFLDLFSRVKDSDPLDQVLFAEFHSKMVNDYLLVEDRMSMAHSVEERVPFLDRELVDFCFNIPIEYKMKYGKTKELFRHAMEGRLPERIIRKKKWGFSVNPYEQFKKDLKTKVEQELTPEYISKQGVFNYKYIKSILDYPSHKNLRWHYNYLWILLGLKKWEQVFKVN